MFNRCFVLNVVHFLRLNFSNFSGVFLTKKRYTQVYLIFEKVQVYTPRCIIIYKSSGVFINSTMKSKCKYNKFQNFRL